MSQRHPVRVEHYTDRARRSVVLAQEHARLLMHAQVDVDHLLLGLAAEGEGVAATSLARLGVSTDGICTAVTRLRSPGDSAPIGTLPLTPELTRSLQYTLREAIQLGCNYIGTEHLLLGLVADCGYRAESTVATVLAECSVKPTDVRRAVMQLVRGHG